MKEPARYMEQYKGHIMTNFEQWTNSLTVEKLIQYFEDGFFTGCTDCPAFVYCSKHMTSDGNCFDIFTAWAGLPITN